MLTEHKWRVQPHNRHTWISVCNDSVRPDTKNIHTLQFALLWLTLQSNASFGSDKVEEVRRCLLPATMKILTHFTHVTREMSPVWHSNSIPNVSHTAISRNVPVWHLLVRKIFDHVNADISQKSNGPIINRMNHWKESTKLNSVNTCTTGNQPVHESTAAATDKTLHSTSLNTRWIWSIWYIQWTQLCSMTYVPWIML